jgi:hypothetical protein
MGINAKLWFGGFWQISSRVLKWLNTPYGKQKNNNNKIYISLPLEKLTESVNVPHQHQSQCNTCHLQQKIKINKIY